MSFDEMQRVIRIWSQGEFETSMLHRSLAFLTMKYSQIPRVCCLIVWNVCYGGDGIINILERICRFLSNLILQDSHVCLFAEVSNTPIPLSTLWKTRMRCFMSTRKNPAGIAPSANPLPGREPARSTRMDTLFQKVRVPKRVGMLWVFLFANVTCCSS